MTPERWAEIEQVLDTVLETGPREWPFMLEKTCGEDKELRREVEKLLRHYSRVETFLQNSAKDWVLQQLPEDDYFFSDRIKEAGLIDRYRIIREIAHGGMGRVFLAERADGEYTQLVALKLLHSVFESESMKRRFRIERQILASLNHPNIARLLDGGVVKAESAGELQHPYFVMEYVEGISIKDYCTQHQLTVRERLNLFIKAAEAVQHAHRNLVVHCDIKPSNILVTEEGELKLLDFGIARLLGGEFHHGTDYQTRTLRQWMTPEYAAPEQIKGERVTTSTDIYQLGVLLYVILTGHHPFKDERKNFHEFEKQILEDDPVKPSQTATSNLLRKKLRGDLDAITLRAMRKEPDVRYASVEALTDDIRRFQAGLPVSARHGSLAYRTRKFVRRQKWTVAAIAVLILLSAGYMLTITISADRVNRALEQAKQETERATQVSDFLETLFIAGDPYRRSGEEPTVSELLDRAVERIDMELTGEPVQQAKLLLTLGDSYSNLGYYNRAKPLITRALDIQQRELGNEHKETALSLSRLGRLIYHLGDYEDAALYLEQALNIQERVSGSDDPDLANTLNLLGNLYKRTGEFSRARNSFERALNITQNSLGENHLNTGKILNNIGLLLADEESYEEAREALLKAASIYETELGPDHLMLGELLGNLSHVHGRLGQHEERVENCERYLEIAENQLDPSHPSVATAFMCLGNAYRATGRNIESIPVYESAIEVYNSSSDADHPFSAYPLANLGHAYRDAGDYEIALSHYYRALDIWSENRAVPRVAGILEDIGRLKLTLDEPSDALAELQQALELRRQLHPEGHWRTAVTLSVLGECLTKLGRVNDAQPLLTGSYDILINEHGIENGYTQDTIKRLVLLYEAQREFDKADQFRKKLAGSMPE